MERITLKVTYYDKENELRTVFLNKEYDDKTKITDLINEYPNSKYFCCENSSFKNGNFFISFLVLNGKCQWLIPYDECLVKDYVDTYFETDNYPIIKFEELRQIGGVSPWQIYEFINIISTIFNFLDDVNKLKQWVDKRLKISDMYVGIDDLENSIIFKKHYALNDFCFEFDIDKECAKVLLKFFGYEYFEEYELYMYVPALHEKNKKKLISQINNL